MGYTAQFQADGKQTGLNGDITNSATSGQPQIGNSNPYTNTIPQWDNQQQPIRDNGIGKGQ